MKYASISEFVAALERIREQEGDIAVWMIAAGWEGSETTDDIDLEVAPPDPWGSGRPKRVVIRGD